MPKMKKLQQNRSRTCTANPDEYSLHRLHFPSSTGSAPSDPAHRPSAPFRHYKRRRSRSDKRTIPRGSRFSTYRTTGIATSRRIDAGRRNRRRIVPHVTSALMKDKHYLYRVAVTCYVDSLFYETGNARRCHERCHSLITQTLCGIGKSTCRNYLRYDRSELLAEVRIPPALKELLHLYVLLVTKCPQTQTAALLQELRRLLEIALRHAGRQGSELTADSLIEWLHKGPKDPFPQK